MDEFVFERTTLSIPVNTLEICGNYLFVGSGSILTIYNVINPTESVLLARKQIFNYSTITQIKITESTDNFIKLILTGNNILYQLSVDIISNDTANNAQYINLRILWGKKSHTTISNVTIWDGVVSDQNITNDSKESMLVHHDNTNNNLDKCSFLYYIDRAIIPHNNHGNRDDDFSGYIEPFSFPNDDYCTLDRVLDRLDITTTNELLYSDTNTYNIVYVTTDGCIIHMKNGGTLIEALDTTITATCFYHSSSCSKKSSLSLVIGTNDGYVRFIEITSNLNVHERVNRPLETNNTKHEGRVFGLAVSTTLDQDIDRIVSIGEDRSIIVWVQYPTHLSCLQFYHPCSRPVTISIITNSNISIIITGSENGLISLWNFEGNLINSFKLSHCKHITSFGYDDNSFGKFLYISTNSGSIHRLNCDYLVSDSIQFSVPIPNVICVVHVEDTQIFAIVEIESEIFLNHYNGEKLISTNKLTNLSNKGITMKYSHYLLTISDGITNVCFCRVNSVYSIESIIYHAVNGKILTINSKCVVGLDVYNPKNTIYLVCMGFISQVQFVVLRVTNDSKIIISTDTFIYKTNESYPQNIDTFTYENVDDNQPKYFTIVGYRNALIHVFEWCNLCGLLDITQLQVINTSYGCKNLRSLSIFFNNMNQPYMFTSGTNSLVTVYEFLSMTSQFKLKQQLTFSSNFSSIDMIAFDDQLCQRYLIFGFYDQKYFAVVDPFSDQILMKIDCGGVHRCWNLNIENGNMNTVSTSMLNNLSYGRFYFTFIKNSIVYCAKLLSTIGSHTYIIENKRFTKEIRAATHIGSYNNFHYYAYGGECSNVYIYVYNSVDHSSNIIWCIKKLDSVILDLCVFNVTIKNCVMNFLITIVGGKKLMYTYYIGFPVDNDITKGPITNVMCYLISKMDHPKSLKPNVCSSKKDITTVSCVSESCEICHYLRKYDYNTSRKQFEKHGYFIVSSENVAHKYFFIRKRLNQNIISNETSSPHDDSIICPKHKYIYYKISLPLNANASVNASTDTKASADVNADADVNRADKNGKLLPTIVHSYFYDDGNERITKFTDLDHIFMISSGNNIIPLSYGINDDIESHHRITNVISTYNNMEGCLLSLVALSNGFVRIYESNNHIYRIRNSKYLINAYNNFSNHCIHTMVHINTPNDCLLYSSTVGNLYIIFDCFSQTDYDDDIYNGYFPEGAYKPGEPLLIDVFRASIISMSVLASFTDNIYTDGNFCTRSNIENIFNEEISCDGTSNRDCWHKNPRIIDSSNIPSNEVTTKMLGDNILNYGMDQPFSGFGVIPKFENYKPDNSNAKLTSHGINITTTHSCEIGRQNSYSFIRCCVFIALGLIDGFVYVLELHINKILYGNIPKYYLRDFHYYPSNESHCGSITDICSLSPYLFVSVAQDRSLRVWYWDHSSKNIICRKKIRTQVYDPSKVIYINGDWDLDVNNKRDISVDLKSLGVNDKCTSGLYPKLHTLILGVFGYGKEFFQLTVSISMKDQI